MTEMKCPYLSTGEFPNKSFLASKSSPQICCTNELNTNGKKVNGKVRTVIKRQGYQRPKDVPCWASYKDCEFYKLKTNRGYIKDTSIKPSNGDNLIKAHDIKIDILSNILKEIDKLLSSKVLSKSEHDSIKNILIKCIKK